MSTVAFDQELQQDFSILHQKQFQAKEIKYRGHLHELKAKAEKRNYTKRLIISVQKSYKKGVSEQVSLENLTRRKRKKIHSQFQQLQRRRNCNFSSKTGIRRIRSKFPMVLSSWRHALKSTNHSAKMYLRTAVNLEKTNAQAPNGKKISSYCSFTVSSIWM